MMLGGCSCLWHLRCCQSCYIDHRIWRKLVSCCQGWSPSRYRCEPGVVSVSSRSKGCSEVPPRSFSSTECLRMAPCALSPRQSSICWRPQSGWFCICPQTPQASQTSECLTRALYLASLWLPLEWWGTCHLRSIQKSRATMTHISDQTSTIYIWKISQTSLAIFKNPTYLFWRTIFSSWPNKSFTVAPWLLLVFSWRCCPLLRAWSKYVE